ARIAKLREGSDKESPTPAMRRSIRKRLHDEVTSDEDYFNILGLPTELISHTLSFLSIEDRLRARVNKRMNRIESESKYYVDELMIREQSINYPRIRSWNFFGEYPFYGASGQAISFYAERNYSSECIRKIASNASILSLEIDLAGSTEFHREVFNLIKEFDIKHLKLGAKAFRTPMLKDMIVDTFFLDLTKSCYSMIVSDLENVTEDGFHQMYKNMANGSTKLRKFAAHSVNKDKFIAFLKLIGITLRGRDFFSNRDIEAYLYPEKGSDDRFHIFDGSLEIVTYFKANAIWYELQLHETDDEIEEAKNREGLERIDVGPV
ncbi:hypothetical protein PENTCL1PPCAC_19396, partial [Pristionchus entomophagus]